ncbi:MAG: hypothetical protein ACYC6Y_19550 [Thermoguttaceae bacterium]
MDIFFESPIPVLLAGLIVGSVLGFAYLNTRRRGLLVAVGVVLALVVAGIALERWKKTDREQIGETLDQLASALRALGLPDNTAPEVTRAVKLLISKQADRTRHLVEVNLALAKITEASYSNLRVEVNKLSLPPSAEVRFDARVAGEGRPPLADVVAHHVYPLEFTIKMVFEKDDRYEQPRWLIGNRIGWRLKTLGDGADPGRFGFDTGDMAATGDGF